jgi:hypothetical protein
VSRFRDDMNRAADEAQQGDWSPRPGNHTALVIEGDAFESNDGRNFAKTRLQLTTEGDPDVGKHWDHLMGLNSSQQRAINFGQLTVYGIDEADIRACDDIDDLARHCAELAGTEVELNCKPADRGGVWTNVTFSRSQQRMNGDVPADTTGLGADAEPASPPTDRDEFGF